MSSQCTQYSKEETNIMKHKKKVYSKSRLRAADCYMYPLVILAHKRTLIIQPSHERSLVQVAGLKTNLRTEILQSRVLAFVLACLL